MINEVLRAVAFPKEDVIPYSTWESAASLVDQTMVADDELIEFDEIALIRGA